MDRLKEIVREEVAWYGSGGGVHHRSYATLDDIQGIYSVNTIGDPGYEYATRLVMLARIVGDKVIIEYDNTNRPLYESLMYAGIPREQIILAYEGEPIPESAK